MKRAYSMDQWQRDFARAFAANVPMEAASTQARGPLLASSNDEPEPDQAAALEADIADSRDPWAERRRREQEALKVERVLSPHLWEQS